MALKLSINFPQYPQGTPFAINDLGVVENGGSADLTEDQERAFVAQNKRSVRDVLTDQAGVTVTGSALLTEKKMGEMPEVSSVLAVTRVADVGDVDAEGKPLKTDEDKDEEATE